MTILIRKATGQVLLALMFIGGGAKAQSLASLPKASQPVEIVGDARPMIAWVDFCNRQPGECQVDTGESRTITLSPKVWQTIVSVNRQVNTTIQPLTDMDHWGVGDRWDLPTDGYGDCEDYQLLKRKLLVESGLPRRAMRMTVVVDEKNEGHAVLLVRTNLGDYVLDNKSNNVLPWYQTGYVYVKRESQDVVAWVSLGGAVSPVATATR